ncbi:unnamed protein product, partial [Medioppia subpectinata]
EDEDRTPARVSNDNEDEDVVIDVVTPHTIHAFLSSDEEDDDQSALIYLPIAPDIDDPELDGPAPPTTPTPRTETPTKSRRSKTIDIDLKEGPKDEAHPLLSGSGKQQNRSVGGPADKSLLAKSKVQRPGGKRSANGSSDVIPNKRNKTKMKMKTELLPEFPMTTKMKIFNFYNYSDEEDDDQSALIYLPIAPDIDDPELDGPAPPTTPTPRTETPTKSRRSKTIDIDLKEGPKDEAHPLLSGSGKQQNRSVGGPADKSLLAKSKVQRPGGKRSANGSSDVIPNKRNKTKKSNEFY